MDLLIPAAGYATRMNGMPKFLLPINLSGQSLLFKHIKLASGFYEKIRIATREEFSPLLNRELLGENVEITLMSTRTMSETILNLARESKSDHFGLVMPDTFFLGGSPHSFLTSQRNDLGIAAWKIRPEQRGKLGQLEIAGDSATKVVDKDPNCDFPYAWGALSFSRDFLQLIEVEMPHIGYGIPEWLSSKGVNSCEIIDGEYYDCGTPSEYFSLLNKIT